MKFNLTSEERSKIDALLETKQINIAFADMLMSFYDYDLSKIKPENKDAFVSLFMEAMELDETNSENVKLINKYIGRNFKKLDDSIFNDNPYFKRVRPQLTKIGDYKLCLDHFYPYQTFAYDDVEIDKKDNYCELSKIGYFDHKVNFLALSYKNEIWMNISPNEINTMKSSIEEANGDILVFGLGLGYYPFMVALKDNVKSVTIIEKDKNIIEIFKKHLFPFFINKDKIQIIEADAFEFMKNNKVHYDYSFVDLWHNPSDGLPMYLKFKPLEDKNCKYSYWLEDSIKQMYRRCVLTVIEEQFAGTPESAYEHPENELDKVINDIYFELKKREVIDYSSIISLLERHQDF